ncbi:MAG: outer membrane beta-barrel protein [Chitinophagaceae bacterium]|nr:outer membrane beta-barrel protein [Chitinophagaceae bacterium]
MKDLLFLISFCLITVLSAAQRVHIGVFGGFAAYNGDLTEKIFTRKLINGSVGVSVNYEWKDRVMLRGGFTYAVVGGADRYNSQPDLVARNLSFETSITEFSAIGEYYFFNLYDQRFSPYVFGGLAVYHFNPYTYYNNNKIYLRPLSTEGQGLPGYPGRQPYDLTQFAIPFGAGIKFALNDKIRIGLELGIRKLFTDYLDDVSAMYADPNDLLAAKGQMAVDLSYRGDELPNGNPVYPDKTAIRGGEKHEDMYYFTGLHLTYRIGGGNGFFGNGNRKKYGCPVVPL